MLIRSSSVLQSLGERLCSMLNEQTPGFGPFKILDLSSEYSRAGHSEWAGNN